MAETKGQGQDVGAKHFNSECLPVGATRPTGGRIKIEVTNGTVQGYWDFSCDDLATALSELERIGKAYCDKANKATPSGNVGGNSMDPFFETADKERTIELKGPDGDFLFCQPVPAGTTRLAVSDLIDEIKGTFSRCCL